MTGAEWSNLSSQLRRMESLLERIAKAVEAPRPPKPLTYPGSFWCATHNEFHETPCRELYESRAWNKP